MSRSQRCADVCYIRTMMTMEAVMIMEAVWRINEVKCSRAVNVNWFLEGTITDARANFNDALKFLKSVVGNPRLLFILREITY